MGWCPAGKTTQDTPPPALGIGFGKSGCTRKHRAWTPASMPPARVRRALVLPGRCDALSLCPRSSGQGRSGVSASPGLRAGPFQFLYKGQSLLFSLCRNRVQICAWPESKPHSTRASWRVDGWGPLGTAGDHWGPLETAGTGAVWPAFHARARGCSGPPHKLV